jgi:hypothetical protein
MDPAKRQALVNAAIKLQHDNVYHVPSSAAWGRGPRAPTSKVVYRPDSWLEVAWVGRCASRSTTFPRTSALKKETNGEGK